MFPFARLVAGDFPLAGRLVGAVEALPGIGNKRIGGRNGRAAVDLADIVEDHVHQAQAPGVGDALVAVERVVLEESLLLLVQVEVVRAGDEVIDRQEEPARAAGRVSASAKRTLNSSCPEAVSLP